MAENQLMIEQTHMVGQSVSESVGQRGRPASAAPQDH